MCQHPELDTSETTQGARAMLPESIQRTGYLGRATETRAGARETFIIDPQIFNFQTRIACLPELKPPEILPYQMRWDFIFI
jgi:hypothetical protein